jgi:DNA-binding transcriptional MocR family regulator
MNSEHSEERRLYRQVAEKITRLIDQGTVRPGERIPSVRKLSQQEGVSVSTVLQAYFLLESWGLVEARPQSGFYVRLPFRKLPPEPQITQPPLSACRVGVAELVAEVFAALHNPNLVPFGAACASPTLFPTEKLNRVLASVARHSDVSCNAYDFPPGNEELRRLIARRSLDCGCSLSSRDIEITFGSTEALNLCLRAVAEPGDTIAVESPTYYGILQMIESLRMKALEIPTHPRKGISLEALDSAIKKHKIKACFVMPNFHNPLGGCMPEESKKQLVELLARREIPLIEDDIHGDLHFGTTRPKTAKAFDKQGLVLLCSSFSKTLAPGYRVGWTVPGRFKAQVERLKLMTTIATVSLTQTAVARFLQSGGYDHYLRKIRKAYATQVDLMTQAITKYFPKGTKVTRPAGGFVLWIEFPKRINSIQLYRRALGENISIAPGPIFSAKQHYQNFIRINCGYPWSDRIEQALITLGRLAEKQI